MNLPLAVVALLPPKREADSGSVGCVGRKGVPQACVKEKINVKLKLRGQLRFSGSSYRTVKKQRNEMLVEREKHRGQKNGAGWSRKSEVKSKEWKQQTKTPPPTPTQQPDLCPIKPTLLMTVWGTAEITGTPLPRTVSPLPPGGGNRGMDKRRAKKVK